MKRRSLFKVGLAGSALLAIGGIALTLSGDPTEKRKKVLDAIVATVLGGALPTDTAQRVQSVTATRDAVIVAIHGLAPASQKELDELFMLLASAPGRLLAGFSLGTDWNTANEQQLIGFLQSWRTHKVDLFKVAYQAFHDLITGTWYADSANWTSIGYSGPLKL
jgi:hypothetical protein